MNQVQIQTDNRRNTALLTALHATVDGLCACVMYRISPLIADYQAMLWLFVAYNALAFVTQPLVGLWTDRRGSHVSLLVTALALLIAGGVVCLLTDSTAPSALPWLAVTLVGVGNSLFHVYGGKEVAVRTRNDIRHLGIFVSSGALGLMLGGRYSGIVGLVCLIGLMAILLALYLHERPAQTIRRAQLSSVPQNLSAPAQATVGFLLFLLLIVFIRSFIGTTMPSEAAGIPAFATIGVLMAVTGKAAGGFVALRWGRWRMLTVTLLLTGVCFLLGQLYAGMLLLMALLINLSMPITLHLANEALPHREGLAFGLLAAVLAPGAGLAMVLNELPVAMYLLNALVATIVIEALVLLAMGERRWQVLGMSVAMNILTNLSLNALVQFGLDEFPSAPVILLLEATVVFIETALFRLVVPSWRRSLLYATACNVISYLAGLLFTLTFTL